MVNSTPFWVTFLLPMLPLALVWVAGVVVALVTWSRHPTVSLVTLLACVLLLLNVVAGTLAQVWLIRGIDAASAGPALGILNLCRVLASVVGYGLLLLAVFGWRARPGPAWRNPARLDEVWIDPDLGGAWDRKSEDIQKGPQAEDR